MGRSTFYRLFILDMENHDVSVLYVQCPTESCAVHCVHHLRARFLLSFNLLLLRDFILSLLGIAQIKQWLLLCLSILGSHHHHNFLSGFHTKTHNKSEACKVFNVVSGTFSSSKITACRKEFVWFLRLCTVTYFRSLYLVYIFDPYTEPKFSFSQIYLGPFGYHTSTTITTPPSLTFISCKVLWVIITILFYIYSCHLTKLYISFV